MLYLFAPSAPSASAPDWQVHSPATAPTPDGEWHASNGSTDLAADSLAALLDELDWLHAS